MASRSRELFRSNEALMAEIEERKQAEAALTHFWLFGYTQLGEPVDIVGHGPKLGNTP